jgi:two-component system CheB/CheR fusion protein
MAIQVSQDFEDLLVYLRDTRGFDFTGYKRPSLHRRVNRRVAALGLDGFSSYQTFLGQHPDEYAELFDSILINVTSFFRDPPTWEYVAEEVIPRLAETSREGPIRVWTTGCATGEEAYTVAILLAEQLGEEQYRHRVKIYATDVDDHALSTGRQGLFSARAVQPVPEELREKYFDRTDRGYTLRKELRRCVIFGRNDLIQDPPISRVDLLTSRNTLMYLTPETQRQVLSNFYFSLKDSGFLVLGKSELLLTRSNLFAPVNLKRRVFQKVPTESLRGRLLTFVERVASADGATAPTIDEMDVRDAAFETAPAAQIVVAAEGIVAAANQQARQLFGLATHDVGRPLQDLEISYRPLELRSLLDQANDNGHLISLRDIEWQIGGQTRYLDVQVIPLTSGTGARLGTNICFLEVTRYRRLQDSLERSNHELETAYEELQATAEELETTNEELQSTNEELETTNEELQSTNEELETMNEELQSTNEELETMNVELQRSSEELNEINAFLESILGSLRGAVIVLDRALRVLTWNDEAAQLWGLRGDEVEEQHFLNLDIGLPVEQLHKPIKSCLAGREPETVELQATNRRGQAITCSVWCAPLRGQGGTIAGVILLMEGSQPQP